jgi:hypothetical protein
MRTVWSFKNTIFYTHVEISNISVEISLAFEFLEPITLTDSSNQKRCVLKHNFISISQSRHSVLLFHSIIKRR